jgi:hypothetical protein
VTGAELAPALVRLMKVGAGLEPPAAGAALPEESWHELLQIAQQHQAVPLLYAAARKEGDHPPAAALDELRRRARATEVRAGRAWEELEALFGALNRAGIEPVVLKGAYLARFVYPTPGLRPFGDLDLLVRPEDRERAAEALMALGYRDYTPKGRDRVYLARHHHHWGFVRQGALLVELHWALTPPSSTVQFDTAALFGRSRHLEVGERQARGLAPSDHFLYTAVHVAKHHFRVPLRSYLDLALILREAGPLDWPGLRTEAEARGAGVDLAAVLATAEALRFLALPPAAAGLDASAAGVAPAALAQYAVDWPFLSRPHWMVLLLGADSPLGAARALREILLPGTARPPARESFPAAERIGSLSRAWGARFRTFGGRAAAAMRQAGSIRTSIAIHRVFRDREAEPK